MKKLLVVLLALAMSVALVFTAVSCGGDNTAETDTQKITDDSGDTAPEDSADDSGEEPEVNPYEGMTIEDVVPYAVVDRKTPSQKTVKQIANEFLDEISVKGVKYAAHVDASLTYGVGGYGISFDKNVAVDLKGYIDDETGLMVDVVLNYKDVAMAKVEKDLTAEFFVRGNKVYKGSYSVDEEGVRTYDRVAGSVYDYTVEPVPEMISMIFEQSEVADLVDSVFRTIDLGGAEVLFDDALNDAEDGGNYIAVSADLSEHAETLLAYVNQILAMPLADTVKNMTNYELADLLPQLKAVVDYATFIDLIDQLGAPKDATSSAVGGGIAALCTELEASYPFAKYSEKLLEFAKAESTKSFEDCESWNDVVVRLLSVEVEGKYQPIAVKSYLPEDYYEKLSAETATVKDAVYMLLDALPKLATDVLGTEQSMLDQYGLKLSLILDTFVLPNRPELKADVKVKLNDATLTAAANASLEFIQDATEEGEEDMVALGVKVNANASFGVVNEVELTDVTKLSVAE
ncbi:MAG: hypothetical protein IJ706_01615 [Clostridia bacterium]|nr:hypothetical protein [Clostridia bacterium]